MSLILDTIAVAIGLFSDGNMFYFNFFALIFDVFCLTSGAKIEVLFCLESTKNKFDIVTWKN